MTVLRTRRLLVPLVLTLAAATLGPALADAPATADCGPGDGSAHLRPGQVSLSFDSPTATAPELAATRDVTGPAATRFRTAVIERTADLAPSSSGTLTATLSWPTAAADYDLYVFDAAGDEIAVSNTQNATDGPGEQLQAELAHCQAFTIEVRNWTGTPVEPLTLSLDLVADGPALPGSPAAVSDTSTRLWLDASAPGNAATVPNSSTVGQSGTPIGTTMSATPPTGGRPNGHARVAGFRDQYRNLLVGWWESSLPKPKVVKGTGSALLYVSSPTLADGGTLYVDLYLDGGLASSVAVPGAAVGKETTAVRVSFPGLDSESLVSSVGLQVGTTPAVSSQGPGNPADAEDTVWFGSVQFPSRVTLP